MYKPIQSPGEALNLPIMHGEEVADNARVGFLVEFPCKKISLPELIIDSGTMDKY
ncbi:MAG: hypothetical protein ACP5KV_08400 [Candidatus Methanomethylicaceae archaeon]